MNFDSWLLIDTSTFTPIDSWLFLYQAVGMMETLNRDEGYARYFVMPLWY